MRVLNYWNLKGEIERGEVRNNYLLVGENDFIKESIITLLDNTIINRKTRAFDKTIFYGDELPDDAYQRMCSPPVSSKRHLVVVYRIDKIQIGIEQIKKAIESSPSFLCIVLTADKKDRRKKSKSLEWFINNTNVLRCRTFSSDEINKWVREIVTKKGFSISTDAINLLGEFVGSDMYTLHSEVEKLLAFNTEGKIERKHVELIVGEERILSIYELQNAIRNKDIQKGLKALENLLIWGEKPTNLLFRLSRWLSSSISGRTYKNSLGINDATKAINILTETELSIKRGEVEDRFAIEELIYRLVNRE
ncbi:DNA polymerase III subunit delta [candidate division WOR-3 bacterium]|nr:DNA polymerase III subunit delta [candidate division WOR-3 bacterium]